MNDLQKITDQLATNLNRAVFIDDGAFRPLAASAQIGRVDDARVQALLDRTPTQEHLRYFASCGVPTARVPLRVPASEQRGLLPRVMIPVMSGTHVLARIWLIDADPPVSDDDIACAVAAIREMRPHLLGGSEAVRQQIAAGGQLLDAIQRAGSNRRQALFKQLRDDFGITDLDHTHVYIIELNIRPDDDAPPAHGDDPTPVGGVLETLLDLLDMHGALACRRGHEVVGLVGSPTSGHATLQSISAAAHRAAMLNDTSVAAVGLGGALETRDGFTSSLRQAEFAAKVAKSASEVNGSACWDDLGEYRLFFAVEWTAAGVAEIHPGVASLIAEKRMPLAATLLAYLEREGDINATSDALSIHRTTLYYRVERATEIVGEQPTGPARFAIHAALRLADLAGLLTPALKS